MFREKTQALKANEMQKQSHSLETTIEQACKTVPKLHILEDVEASTKVRKLASVVCTLKDEVGRVTFEFSMKISEL